LVRLRVKQVNQIGVDVVHIPSLTSVQEGVSFSVVKGVSFGVAPHRSESRTERARGHLLHGTK
jgi:hypothetical protein